MFSGKSVQCAVCSFNYHFCLRGFFFLRLVLVSRALAQHTARIKRTQNIETDKKMPYNTKTKTTESLIVLLRLHLLLFLFAIFTLSFSLSLLLGLTQSYAAYAHSFNECYTHVYGISSYARHYCHNVSKRISLNSVGTFAEVVLSS